MLFEFHYVVVLINFIMWWFYLILLCDSFDAAHWVFCRYRYYLSLTNQLIFPWKLTGTLIIILRWTEGVAQRCSVKKVFLEISQNSQENTCARVSFLIKLQTWGCFWMEDILNLYKKNEISELTFSYKKVEFSKLKQVISMTQHFCVEVWSSMVSILNVKWYNIYVQTTELSQFHRVSHGFTAFLTVSR